jgi:acyl carrier protein
MNDVRENPQDSPGCVAARRARRFVERLEPVARRIPEFDSMAVVSIIGMIEEEYGFVVDDDEMSADVFETLDSLATFVAAKAAR